MSSNRVQSINDMKTDVVNHKQMLKQSEDHRDDLQTHMKQTSVNIQKDTESHKTYQN